MTVNNIQLPAVAMQGFETEGLGDDFYDLYVTDQALFLDNSSISNILSFGINQGLLQQGFMSYFPDKSLLDINDIFHRPRVVNLDGLDIIAETPFEYLSSFQNRNPANNPCYILNNGRGVVSCISALTPIPVNAITQNTLATASVKAILTLDNITDIGDSDVTVDRNIDNVIVSSIGTYSVIYTATLLCYHIENDPK